MKSHRESPSTDCFSDEMSYYNESNLNSDKLLIFKNNIKTIVDYVNKSNNKLSLKQTVFNNKVRNINKTPISKSRCNSSTGFNNIKIIQYNNSKKYINKEKSSKKLFIVKSQCNLNNESNQDLNLFNSKEIIDKEKIKNDLENSILNIVKEVKNYKDQIEILKESMSFNNNENKKISLIHQRFGLQSNYIEKEKKKSKDDLINVIYNI